MEVKLQLDKRASFNAAAPTPEPEGFLDGLAGAMRRLSAGFDKPEQQEGPDKQSYYSDRVARARTANQVKRDKKTNQGLFRRSLVMIGFVKEEVEEAEDEVEAEAEEEEAEAARLSSASTSSASSRRRSVPQIVAEWWAGGGYAEPPPGMPPKNGPPAPAPALALERETRRRSVPEMVAAWWAGEGEYAGALAHARDSSARDSARDSARESARVPGPLPSGMPPETPTLTAPAPGTRRRSIPEMVTAWWTRAGEFAAPPLGMPPTS